MNPRRLQTSISKPSTAKLWKVTLSIVLRLQGPCLQLSALAKLYWMHPPRRSHIPSACSAGLEVLSRQDGRLAAFRSTLFSQAGVEYNRDQQTAEANAKLDKSLAAYLQLLADHLLQPAAWQTLEFIVRRYRSDRYLRSTPSSSSGIGQICSCVNSYVSRLGLASLEVQSRLNLILCPCRPTPVC